MTSIDRSRIDDLLEKIINSACQRTNVERREDELTDVTHVMENQLMLVNIDVAYAAAAVSRRQEVVVQADT